MSGSDPFERSPLLPQAVIEEEGEVRAIGVAEDDSTNQLRRSKWRLLWQKARRKATVFLWRTSESERKRQKLRRSHIGAAAFLIRDAVLGAYHPVDDPAAVMVEGGMTAVYDPHDYHHHHHPDDDETTAANCFVFFHATFCLWCRRWCNHWTLWYLLHCTMTCLILLTFVEPPHWCRDYYQENIVRENGGPKIAQPGGGGCEALLTATGPPATTSTNDNSMAVDVDYYYPNAGTGLWLTVPQSQVTETILLVVIATILLVRIGRDGLSLRRYLRRSPVRTNRVTQLFCLLALATGLALEQGSHPNLVALKYTAQYHAYFRLFLLFSFLGRSQREIRVLIDMLPVSLVMVATPFCCCFGFWFYLLQLTFFCVGRALSLLFVVRQEVFKILVLLCVITLFYAFFGIVVFVGTAEGAQHFSNLVEAVWTLLICVTTANYLDVAMPGYKENRWVALYFVTFMIISYFFLMNVILASVVNEYDTAVLEHRRKHEEMSTLNLQNAFRLLTLAEDEENSGLLPDRGDIPIREKTIDRQTILDLFFILNNDFPEFRHLSDDDAKLLFAILDRDGSSMISEEEFMDFGNVLLQAFSKTSDYTTFLEMHYPRFFHSDGWQRFGRIIKSTSFDHAMDLILAMNALVVTIQTWPELSGQVVALDSKYYYGIIDTFWEYMETVFTAFYSLEVLSKVAVFGWKAYAERTKNLFDLSITLMAIFSTGVVYYQNIGYNDSQLIRMILTARVLRLIRLLTARKPFQLIFRSAAEIVPAATSVILILFLIVYFFAALGMQLYGGLITRDPQNPIAYRLLETDFAKSDYWANNFNDMMSSMNVLYLVIVNNWFVIEIGLEAATQTKWVRLFFFSFHLFGVILVNNLVIACIINKFLQQHTVFSFEQKDEVVGDGQAILVGHRHALFNASSITGTRTSLKGDYIVQLRYTHADLDGFHHRERLRSLFTQTSRSTALIDENSR